MLKQEQKVLIEKQIEQQNLEKVTGESRKKGM